MATLYHPVLTYDPITDPTGRRTNHYQVERSRDGFVFEALADPLTGTATPFYRGDSLIIATAGSYRHEMFVYPGPRASYAVFLGPSNPLNDSGTALVAPPGAFLSLQRGALAGAVAALRTVVRMLEKGLVPCGGAVGRVIVKTDSEYVALGCTERIGGWVRRGWLGCGESRIRDWDLWEVVLALLDVIMHQWGVEILFWLVPAEWNRDAKYLAAEGLKIPPPFVVDCRPRSQELREDRRVGVRC
ncbi:hypothetical protein KVR01_000195 [Diaporthe batatas]|uniref:uncharacterized protein n=1 Tax=Diaporthe batatas TaxID=748121 RepID=UPI001D044E12|nr:uncharacterized protein KVR01_000195 [Diaporthe batatas]KAG8169450.1 hypothetical protein KVR01_000195 [Diaporthe batatas]